MAMGVSQKDARVNGRAEIYGYFLNNLTNTVFVVVCRFGLSRLGWEQGL